MTDSLKQARDMNTTVDSRMLRTHVTDALQMTGRKLSSHQISTMTDVPPIVFEPLDCRRLAPLVRSSNYR
jgi:hypothetical protein